MDIGIATVTLVPVAIGVLAVLNARYGLPAWFIVGMAGAAALPAIVLR